MVLADLLGAFWPARPWLTSQDAHKIESVPVATTNATSTLEAYGARTAQALPSHPSSTSL